MSNRQDDTQPIKIPYPIGKKPTGLYLTIGVLVILVAVLALFLMRSGNGLQPEPAPPPITDTRDAAPPLDFQTAQQHVSDINQIESEVRDNQKQMIQLAADYKEKAAPDTSTIDMLDLNAAEREILSRKMNEAGDVSIKSLLQDILKRDAVIRRLRVKISRIETLLPKPHIVGKGDTHFQIAWNYLVKQKGLPPSTAETLIKRISLFDTLVPGFKVWNFYSGRDYGTFVTQGRAGVSPYEAKQRVRKRLITGRDKAIKTLNKKEQEYQKRINSLYYRIDTRKNLIKDKILKPALFKTPKLLDVSPETFDRSLDLRDTVTIRIAASHYRLKRIKKILLYPRFYKEGDDYEITISDNKETGRLTILAKEKFLSERIIISVE